MMIVLKIEFFLYIWQNVQRYCKIHPDSLTISGIYNTFVNFSSWCSRMFFFSFVLSRRFFNLSFVFGFHSQLLRIMRAECCLTYALSKHRKKNCQRKYWPDWNPFKTCPSNWRIAYKLHYYSDIHRDNHRFDLEDQHRNVM